MKTGVIILNWNGAKLLREFLPSVVANTNPKIGRVIVADNGSDDNSIEILRTEFPDVEIITFDKNYGFAGGYNKAIEAVADRFDKVVLLNSDVETPEGWLEPLVEWLDEHPQTGVVQPKILSYTDKTSFEYAGASGGLIDKHGYPWCRGRIFDTCERDNGQYDNPMSIFWATGAALCVRTKLYLEVGGLDEDFFAHMEEIDLCWRILLAGNDIYVVPESRVYHLGGGSLPASNPKKTYLNFRNNLLLLHKNLPETTRCRKLFVRRLLDTIAWAKFAATFDFANARAVWRAHRDFAKMRKKYTDHPSVDLLDKRTDTHRNILIDYYLRGRRTY